MVTWLITIIFTDAQCMQKLHTPGIQRKDVYTSTYVHIHLDLHLAEQTSHVAQLQLRTEISSAKHYHWQPKGPLKASTRWSLFSVVLLLQEIKHKHSSPTREHSKTENSTRIVSLPLFKINVKHWKKSWGFRINSKRINRLPLSWPHWTTFKPLCGFVCSKKELCSVFVVIVGRQWSDQILITLFSLIDFSLPQIVLTEILFFFSPSVAITQQWELDITVY